MSKLFLRRRVRDGERDAGMTLPEVLITMVIMGTLMSALIGATTVILRQQDNSSGRLNNARSEQNVGIWMPSDLASAEDVVTDPAASPCGTQCPPGISLGGSNTLMLSWSGSIPGATTSIPTRTTVSYRYVQVGTEFQIIRVKCLSVAGAAPTCDQTIVLHDMPPPPPGQVWIPGTTSPVWVMVVRLATDPAALDLGPDDTTVIDPTFVTKNGRRVTVTINGGGDLAGAGGGEDSITLSAGGTDRKPDLSTSNFSDPPSFGATRSRCGGNFAMLVDTSGSIGSANMTSVKNGITAFIDSFAGTPIKLEVVRFSSTATTLGAGTGWSRWYDMLVASDVTDLKAQVATLTSTGGTNWEDGMFRIFKNSNGTVQSILPDTLIFFTDGLPTRNRLDATSASSPAVVDPDDIGLPVSNGGSFHQVSWNRAWRIARDYYADVDRFIGVYVGTDVNSTSTWYQQGAGYHFENFVRGYNNTWDRGYHLENFQRGYKLTNWQRGYRLSNPQRGYKLTNWQRGYHFENLQRGYHLDYQRATTGVVYERRNSSSSSWYSSGISWDGSGSNSNKYARSNSNNTESDNYRTRVTGTPGGWTTITDVNGKTPATLYNQSNLNDTEADGYRIVKDYSSPYDAYETTDSATFAAGNPSLPTLSAGFTASTVYTAPYTYWATATESAYNSGNTTADSTDGWQATKTYASPYSLWEATTDSAYLAGNTTADNTDGWTATTLYTAPFLYWAAATESAYNSGNTTADSTDGWQVTKTYASPYTLWESTTEALYNTSNTTADSTDGWQATTVYTAPYTLWASATQSAYNAGNSTADALDGWRKNNVYAPPYTFFEPTTEALYNAGNTTSDTTDGWGATKVYTLPYAFHENTTSYSRANTAILAQIVSEGAVVPAIFANGAYTNAAVADFYVLPNWSQFAGALNAMALAECGGTVTVQTKVGTASAADPFTYQNSVDLTTATTSGQFRSGTFDFELAGGTSRVVDITPLNVSGISKFAPVGWACTSAGAAYPFTTTPISGSPWSKITLTVAPNQAISCIQTVRLT